MILFDPDLDPDPAPASATRSVLSVRRTEPQSIRLPSLRALMQFFRAAQAAVRLKGKVSVLLTKDQTIRKLNRQFRGVDKATDVLSFPAADAGITGIAGDLAIGVPTARRQAVEQGHSLGTEIKVLILHGLLHLAGYDHEADDGQMARRERLLRKRLGLPEGLIERSSGAKGRLVSVGFMRGLKPPPPSVPSFSEACKAQAPFRAVSARLKSCPDTKLATRSRRP
jgi:probable rRNA maturation factor